MAGLETCFAQPSPRMDGSNRNEFLCAPTRGTFLRNTPAKIFRPQVYAGCFLGRNSTRSAFTVEVGVQVSPYNHVRREHWCIGLARRNDPAERARCLR